MNDFATTARIIRWAERLERNLHLIDESPERDEKGNHCITFVTLSAQEFGFDLLACFLTDLCESVSFTTVCCKPDYSARWTWIITAKRKVV